MTATRMPRNRATIAQEPAKAGAAPDTLTFVFPMPTNLANRGRGASRNGLALSREKKRYLKSLDTLQAAGVLPPPPDAAFATARISSVMVLGSAMDDDNAMTRHKWPKDWLKTRGYIVDDSKKHLTWTGFPEQRVSRKEEASITITLEAA